MNAADISPATHRGCPSGWGRRYLDDHKVWAVSVERLFDDAIEVGIVKTPEEAERLGHAAWTAAVKVWEACHA